VLKFACFVTGTDTGIGKTRITLGLMAACKGRGLSVAGMKPVASGAQLVQGRLVNDDALKIRAACSAPLAYELINPCVMREAIAPHIAAEKESTSIELANIVRAFRSLSGRHEALVVEGAGGWRVPLGQDLQTSALVEALQLPVVLTVGLRLGCINHALLSAEAIQADGHTLLGWVANQIDPAYKDIAASVATIGKAIAAPLLGHIPHSQSMDAASVARTLEQAVFQSEAQVDAPA